MANANLLNANQATKNLIGGVGGAITGYAGTTTGSNAINKFLGFPK